MKAIRLLLGSALMAGALCASSCSNDDPNPDGGSTVIPPADPDPFVYNPASAPEFHYSITPYSGTIATDGANDNVDPADADIYHENNKWDATVTVTFSGNSATVNSEYKGVTYSVSGADVNLNLGDTYADVTVKGESDNGSLRIEGNHRHRLHLESLRLKSLTGPAINDQNKKRVFVWLDGDSYLEDSPQYAPAANPDEDRKGCFFAEGNVILSGSGTLHIAGRQRHGLATDGFLVVRPGTTLVVSDAAKNAIHVKGSNGNGIGIMVMGGYIYANTSAPAGKVMKCDMQIMVRGGRLDLNCSGNPAIDPDDNTLSSSACIKSASNLFLSGGTLALTATGNGGKGINIDGKLYLTGSMVTVSLSGDHLAGNTDTATPKAVKVGGDTEATGGRINASAIGRQSMAMDCTGAMRLNGSILYLTATNYGLRTAGALTLDGGTLAAGAQRNLPASLTGAMPLLTFSMPGVNATDRSQICAPDGTLVGAMTWPVSLADGASLIFASESVKPGTDYTLQ